MFTAQKVYAMLENESLWQTATRCHELLAAVKIPHAIMGGVAVCLRGYQRNTVDVNLLIRSQDSDAVRATLEDEDFIWKKKEKEFRSSSGVAIQFLIAGEKAGSDSEVKLPEPADEKATTEIEDLAVVTRRG